MLHRMVFLAGMLCALSAWAVDPSTNLQTYYAAANGKAGYELRSALSGIISPHTTVSYDNLRYLYQYSDTYNAEGNIIEDIYSNCNPTYTTSFCSGDCGYNREHSLPKSWWNTVQDARYSDAFHLYPTNCYVNSFRGNYAFGECASGEVCTTNGISAKGRKGKSTFVAPSGKSYVSNDIVYEPDDAYKGDLARSYFYMVTCYINSNYSQADGGVLMFEYTNNIAELSQYSIDLLLKWHRQDPVSEKELIRNEVIYGNPTYNKCSYSQGNRNPFIDYPCLAEYIWGEHKGEAVDLSALVSGYAGVGTDCCSGGGGGVDPTPPPTPEEYTIAWSIKGETNSDKVKEGEQPTPPSVPDCSTSRVFMGWTTSSTVDDEPAILYADDEIPVAEAAVTYYAVFADKSTGGSGTKETTFAASDFSGQGTGSSGSPISVTKDGITLACDKGYGADPIRCYKNGIISITSSDPIKALAFSLGGTYTGGMNTSYTDLNTTEWTFTLTSQARISSVTVTTGGATTYSNYGLQCEETPECKATITILSADENQGTVEFVEN